jgi:hypothetical protein
MASQAFATQDYIVNKWNSHSVSIITSPFQTAEQVTGFCRSPVETRKSSPTGSVASSHSQALLTPSRQLSDAEKLRKVVLELVDTERTYVKVRAELDQICCAYPNFCKNNMVSKVIPVEIVTF